jgi:hypothetical protein
MWSSEGVPIVVLKSRFWYRSGLGPALNYMELKRFLPIKFGFCFESTKWIVKALCTAYIKFE